MTTSTEEAEPIRVAARLNLPAVWAEDYHGGVRLRRRFGYPGRIDAHERVWLLVEGLHQDATVSLNDVELGRVTHSAEFEITARLQPRNELVVELDVVPGATPFEEVRLEVRAQAYLRDVVIWREAGQLRSTGKVVGQAEHPLDLYLVSGRRPVGYARVSATPEGMVFCLEGEEPEERKEDELVKIELVCGAVAWYTMERLPGASAFQGPCA